MNTKGNNRYSNNETISDKEKTDMRKTNGRYTEVSLDNMSGTCDGRNPLRKRFQYEYALYMLISEMFHSVRNRSRSIESLRLYYMDLPDKGGKKPRNTEEESKGKTKSDVVTEVAELIIRDLKGHIPFPMMHICAVESRAVLEEDGSHTFIFTDGIYSFSVHLDMYRNREIKKIKITDLRSAENHDETAEAKETEKTKETKDEAALKSAA